MEIFAEEGTTVFTGAVFPPPGSDRLRLRSDTDDGTASVSVHKMSTIWPQSAQKVASTKQGTAESLTGN